ncbi:phospholipase D/nuclease [Lepidopterella palustris CBS 459.81]|uniref:Phospholipase D/nuclease n=1 Tax=Lepidopterella palustris CBS 459.81 TaxID=1314670 RepID=A0A8E2E9D1_9PEZI|nr:phospholipase D/nuclease [Lepidopterella palustris CBS 459.81]
MYPNPQDRPPPRAIDFAAFNKEWQEDLLWHREKLKQENPNYYIDEPSTLITSSSAHSFITGTGSDIFNTIFPHISAAESEIIIVTCFWARSSSLKTLSNTLRSLSTKALNRGGPKIRIRIAFSSLSLFQKLFHTQSTKGQIYPPSTWTKRLGLPSPDELGGLDLKIKSIFLLPFSIMHPKFIIVDRKKVFLPSCNVSWEVWFEGCIELSGPILSQFVRFWEEFWARDEPPQHPSTITTTTSTPTTSISPFGPAHSLTPLSPNHPIPTLFLPSPHHINPSFQPFTYPSRTIFPPTPLNTALLLLLSLATSSIYIQTPNLTSPPVLTALLRALRRGISIHILTSARLMILEQLITAGTTTLRCMKKLVKRYKALYHPPRSSRYSEYGDEEAALGFPLPGQLKIEFFEAKGGLKARGMEGGEPQKSHLKLLIVDEEVVVLGSGNLDRASWFTSQELGVMFFDPGMAGRVRGAVGEMMDGRVKGFYES